MRLHLRDAFWLMTILAVGCVLYRQTMEMRSLQADLSEMKRGRRQLERSLKAMTNERDFRQEMAVALEAALVAHGHSASLTRDPATGQLRVVELSQSSH